MDGGRLSGLRPDRRIVSCPDRTGGSRKVSYRTGCHRSFLGKSASEFGKEFYENREELYRYYKTFCENQNERVVLDSKQFKTQITPRFEDLRVIEQRNLIEEKQLWVWVGVRLKHNLHKFLKKRHPYYVAGNMPAYADICGEKPDRHTPLRAVTIVAVTQKEKPYAKTMQTNQQGQKPTSAMVRARYGRDTKVGEWK